LYFRILLAVRDTCADWLKGVEPQDDPATKGKKEDNGFHIKVLLLHRYMF
jgi:cytoplasmic FMR1 interacting protein